MTARFEAQWLRAPIARPDEAALRAAHAGWLARQAEVLRAGTAVGAAPWTRPSVRPAIAQPFAELALTPVPAGPGGAPDAALAAALAEVLARELDGGWRLDQLPRLAGLGFRLQVKRNDLAWWRPVAPTDPWDAGWLRPTPEACDAVATRFLPRRSTLLLAEASQAAVLRPVRDALLGRAAGLPRAVRWVWVA